MNRSMDSTIVLMPINAIGTITGFALIAHGIRIITSPLQGRRKSDAKIQCSP